MSQYDIYYALDPTLPDPVCMGSLAHFNEVGIFLYGFPDHELPVMLVKAPQIPMPTPIAPLMPATAPNMAPLDFMAPQGNGSNDGHDQAALA